MIVQAEIHSNYREAALDGLYIFFHIYLNETIDYDALYLVLGNKSAFKILSAF
jgi:hypothetical protein